MPAGRRKKFKKKKKKKLPRIFLVWLFALLWGLVGVCVFPSFFFVFRPRFGFWRFPGLGSCDVLALLGFRAMFHVRLLCFGVL